MSESNENSNWIQAMIEREALPQAAREGTVAEFCIKWGISESTYYYQSSKKENWQEILKISLSLAKRDCPEVLKILSEKAKSGDMKAVEMYLNYIVQLAKNLDIKTGGDKFKTELSQEELEGLLVIYERNKQNRDSKASNG